MSLFDFSAQLFANPNFMPASDPYPSDLLVHRVSKWGTKNTFP